MAEQAKQLADSLGPQQFAIGTAAGTEVLGHTARALAEDNPDLVFVALNAENAYSSAKRRECLAELGVLDL